MARKCKFGGRHASVMGDRFIQVAARDALAAFGGIRISCNRVIGRSSKSHPRGSWRKRRGADQGSGGILVVLYGDPVAVEASIFLAANDNDKNSHK